MPTVNLAQQWASDHPILVADSWFTGTRSVLQLATGNYEQLDIHRLARRPVTTADVAGKTEIRLLLNGCFDIMHAGHYNALRQVFAQPLFECR